MFRRSLAYIFPLILLVFGVKAQDQNNTAGYENGSTLNVLYRSDVSAKIYAHTRGYGILIRRGKHVTFKSRTFYEFDLQTLKHPKEIRKQGDADSRRNFIYGKINNVFSLRGSLGMQNVLFTKADNKAVEIRYSYSLGPVISFVKPYYLLVYKTTGNGDRELVKFNDAEFNSGNDQIVGRGPFSKGLDEIKLYPGLNAKFNLSFEYAPYTNLIRAIETGVSLDYYPKALPIMAKNPAENFILTLNVGFVFGRKWY
jgi:hypothetical protein